MKIRRVVRLLALLLAAGSIHTGAYKPDPCAAAEPIAAGDSATDAVADVAAAHIDITDVETSLSGESLTVIFHLRDLPNFLTFNRAGVPPGAIEYFWRVAVDVDNDRGTGRGGFDALLSAYHVVGASERSRDTAAPIGEILQAATWGRDRAGYSGRGRADVEVSAESDTITLSAVIPGITAQSRLSFETLDLLDYAASDHIECHPPYSHVASSWWCQAGAYAVPAGRTVSDAAADTTKADPDRSPETQMLGPVFAPRGSAADAPMDITAASSALSGERLTVVFHLRDVPERMTFNRTGVRANSIEYSWGAAIDVDNDRTTGHNGFDALLSAYYIVPSSESDSKAFVPIESRAAGGVWKMIPTGILLERGADLEVSAEADTITLSAEIPGIKRDARLAFRTWEDLGSSDELGCSSPPRPRASSGP